MTTERMPTIRKVLRQIEAQTINGKGPRTMGVSEEEFAAIWQEMDRVRKDTDAILEQRAEESGRPLEEIREESELPYPIPMQMSEFMGEFGLDHVIIGGAAIYPIRETR